MSEQEPDFPIVLNGQEFHMRRDNAILFTHLGELAVWDHIFVRYQEEPPKWNYIPSTAEIFPTLVEFMRENRYTRHEDLQEVNENDQAILMRFWTRDIQDKELTVPQEWLEDGTDQE